MFRRRRKLRLAGVAAVAASALVAAGCGGSGTPSSGGGGTRVTGGTATIALPAGITQSWIWPFYAITNASVYTDNWFQHQMYRPLYKAAGGEAFGTLLRGHRAVAGLTQEELAELAGLSVRAVANWERGRARPRRHSVALLADALGLSIRQRKLFTQAARAEPAAGGAALPRAAMAEPGTGSQPASEVPVEFPAARWRVADPAAELDQLGVWLRVLGPVQVRGGDAWLRPPGAQLRLLLARLALSAARVVLVDDLIDVLWVQRPPPSARASLQILVVGLRKALVGLPGCSLERYGDGYQLRVAPDKVDVHRFRSLVCSAREAPDEHHAIAAFDQALALWRGLLPGRR